MAGAARAAEYIGHSRHYYTGLLSHTVGVDFFIIGAEQIIATSGFELGAIGSQGPRIFVPIFIQTELQRVHENTGNHHLTIALGNLHQLNMGIVQIAHSGHKTYALTGFALRSQRVTKGLDVMKNLHVMTFQGGTKTGADNTRLENVSTFLLVEF